MRLCTFRVKNFKQFEDIKLDLTKSRNFHFNTNAMTPDRQLVKTGLIYGRNNSGKSNLGRAIMDIRQHLSMNPIDLGNDGFFLNANSKIPYATFSYTFAYQKRRVVYTYKKDRHGVLLYESLTVDDRLVCLVNRLSDTPVLEIPGKEAYGFASLQWDGFKESTISIIRYIVFNSPLAKDNVLVQLVAFVSGMLMLTRFDRGSEYRGRNPVYKQAMVYILQSGVDKFNAFLRLAGIQEEVVVKKDITGDDALFFRYDYEDLPVETVGSSGMFALTLLYALLQNLDKASFVFIDESDAFYHFELSRFVFSQLKEKKAQCLMTTHNLNLLTNNVTRPDACFIITKEGIASLTERLGKELHEGHNLEKMYVANEFGAK